MNLSSDTLRAIMPRCPADTWAAPLIAAMGEFDIATPLRVAGFLAQLAHESNQLTVLQENLNYSAQGLLATFPNHFDVSSSVAYARQPSRIANRVYASRNGNGDEASGDGWLFRGRGPIQITGRANYRASGTALGATLELYPDMLLDPRLGSRSAAWFWTTHGCNPLADAADIEGMTRKVNGGLNGLDDRKAYYAKAREVLTLAEAA